MHTAASRLYRLRPATPEDLPFQELLYGGSRQDELDAARFPAEMRASFLAMQFQAQTTHYLQYYPAADWLIIECGDVHAGRLILDRAKDHLHVMDILLLPEFRGRGIGSDVLRGVIAEASARTVPVRLFAAPRERAIELYRRLGFQEKQGDNVHIELEWRPTP